MASAEAPDHWLSLIDDFCDSCRSFVGGVVYRMATHRRLVAAIAQNYAAAALPLRTAAICRLANAAASEDLHRSSRSMIEALLAAAATLPGGPIFPINLRADLLSLLTRRRDTFSVLQIDRLQHLDSILRWLFLRQSAVIVRRLSVHEPTSLLAFLERVEAVHPFTGGRAELLRRLGGDPGRVAFGLFFASMPDTPLAVVYAVVGPEKNPPSSVTSILSGTFGAETGPPAIACFYSITNCYDGLQSLQLGSFLIFLAIEELREEWPCLASFVTLSPVPLFGAWLRARLEGELRQPHAGADELRLASALKTFVEVSSAIPVTDIAGREAACPPWLRHELVRYVAHYIMFERRTVSSSFIQSRGPGFSSGTGRTKCVDPVANFHLANGGTVDRVLCCADLTARGITAAFGCMVNYRYDLEVLSGRAPAWRYSALGVLSSYRAARQLLPLGSGPDVFSGFDLDDFVKDGLFSAPVLARVCSAGEMIACPEDQETQAFYIVVAGSIDVFETIPPRETGEALWTPPHRVLCRVSAGQALGAVSEHPTTRLTFVARASSDSECHVVVIPRETVLHLRKTRPEIAGELRKRAMPVPSVVYTLATPKL